MATNKSAQDRLHDAILTYLASHGPHLSTAQKQRLTKTINILKEEHDAVIGRVPADTYDKVASRIHSAVGRLEKIEQERDELANSLVKASKILSVTAKVLNLVV